ncbi:unnamed protein product [Bemisia tabaci]|uniref:Metalloendopeptidase n=1 Tax=Bemisia tabaci TaxID=7038 RepID=A0A9P0ALM9_BEMTA|nr:unnamed protein product [Bemisia tabaci]
MVVITRLKLFIFVFVSLVCVVEVFIIEDEYASVRGWDRKRRSKKLLNARDLLWRHAAVIYKVDDAVGCPDSWRCFLIMTAMHEYTEKTCVRFQQWTGEKDVVTIKEADLHGGGGGADRGRIGGEQRILIGGSYWTVPILLHELGHTLSLHDEHMRPDRKYSLEVLWDNIRPECYKYFKPIKREDINLLGVPFDPDSIMMYDDEACAMTPGEQTLRLKSGQPIIRSENLSPGDVRRIQDLYRCEGVDQKRSFPRDVFCDFDSNSCGFNGLNTGTWKWIRFAVVQGGT